MTKKKDTIQEKGSITKGMYIKESKWLPVIYTPLQDLEAFCSIYCRGRDGIPLILNKMIEELEKETFNSYPDWGENLSEKEVLECKIKAWRQAQRIWNFFRQSAKQVNDEWRSPFSIRIRHMTIKK